MKTFIFLSILTLLSFTSYNKTNDVKEKLNNPESRKEIFNTILNDHEYMTEFIQAMHGNQHAMMMMYGDNNYTIGKSGNMVMNDSNQMMGNQEQMGMNGQNHMMDRSYFINMMNNYPGMMQMMMGNMIDVVAEDSKTCHNFVDLMYSHHQMRQMIMQQINRNDVAEKMEKEK